MAAQADYTCGQHRLATQRRALRRTAQRELGEEAGVSARAWLGLGTCLSSPGVFTETLHLFLATGIEPAAARHESAEVIEVHWVPIEAACAWALDGTITDGKTALGLLRARHIMARTPPGAVPGPANPAAKIP